MLLFLLIAAAGAHRPHTPITALAPAPDFEESGRVWASLERYGFTPMVYSDDHGAHWDYYAGDPMADTLVDAGYTEDGTLVFAAEEGRLWLSDDEGGAWTSDARLAEEGARISAMAIGDGVVLAATDRGVYAVEPGGALQRISAPEAVDRIAADPSLPGHYVAATEAGLALRALDGGELEPLDALPDELPVNAVAAGGGAVYAGSNLGQVFSWVEPGPEGETGGASEGGWRRCGAIDYDEDQRYADVVTRLLVLPGDRLALTTGPESLFISDDGCETWRFTDTGLGVSYGALGGADSPDMGYTQLAWRGSYGLVAGYNGVALTTNDAATWRLGKLVPSDFIRGVAISPDFPSGHRIWQATYGGGVTWTDDGGRSWGGSAVGMTGESDEGAAIYSFGMSASADPATPEAVFYSGSYLPYRSLDGGETWSLMDVGFENAKNFFAFGHKIYAIERAEAARGNEHVAAVSSDLGLTWRPLEGLAEAAGLQGVTAIAESCLAGRSAILATVNSPPGLLAQVEGEDRWQRLIGTGDPSSHYGGGAWPPGDCSRLLFISGTEGARISDDLGQTWTAPAAPPEDGMNQLVQADDGTWFLSTRTGWIYRSRDGGDTWERVGDRIAPLVLSMATSPSFEQTGLLVLGTHAGLWWASDGEDVWHRMPRYERFEAGSIHLGCTPARAARDSGHDSSCATYTAEDHGAGGGWLMGRGDTARFSFEGTAFRVVGTLPAGGELAVVVDGAWVDSPGAGDSLYLDGLDAGWHDVELTVTDAGDDAFRLDLVETFGEGEVIPSWSAVEDGEAWPYSRCACNGPPAADTAWLILLLPLGALGRRRR